MISIIDADSIGYIVSFNCVKEGLVELDDFKRKVDSYLLQILTCTNSQNYIMFLGGKGNFRFNIEAQKPYKGNRGKGEKPLYLGELRQYLVDVYKANLVNNCESDDYVSMTQRYYRSQNIESCICSNDHDMLQIPGYHVNIRRFTVIELSDEEANRNFWLQLCTGCTTDHVTGLEGCGTKCAENLLNGAKQERYPEIVFQSFKDKYGEDEGIRLFKANYMLIRLMTSNNHFKLPKVENIDERIEHGIHKDT